MRFIGKTNTEIGNEALDVVLNMLKSTASRLATYGGIVLERGSKYWWYSNDAFSKKLANTALATIGSLYTGALAWEWTGGLVLGPGNRSGWAIMKGVVFTSI